MKFKVMNMLRAIDRSQRSQCISNRVGAIIAIGGRAVAWGENNTVDLDCRCNSCNNHMVNDDGKLKAVDRPEHSAWSNDNEIHAEMKALLSAHTRGVILKDAALYTTASPCLTARNISNGMLLAGRLHRCIISINTIVVMMNGFHACRNMAVSWNKLNGKS